MMTTNSSGDSVAAAAAAAAGSPTSTSPMSRSPKPTCRPGQANGSRRCHRFHPQLVLRLIGIRQGNVIHQGGQLPAITAGAGTVEATVLLLLFRVRVIVAKFHRTARIPSLGSLGTILPPHLPPPAGRTSVATATTTAATTASMASMLVIANNVWRVGAVLTCRCAGTSTTRGGVWGWAHFSPTTK